MKRKWTRLLAAALCAAMVLGMAPCFRASAAEEEAEIVKVIQDASGVSISYTAEPLMAEARDSEELIQLGTPTDLRWGYTLDYQYNEETEQYEQVLVESDCPTDLTWKTTLPDQAEHRLILYKCDDAGDERVSGIWHSFGSQGDVPEYRDDYILAGFEDLESGTYYFTVQSKGDGTQYSDSEVAVSDTWTYVKPDAKLGGCSNLTWEGSVMHWDLPEGAERVDVEIYFAQTAEEEPRIIGGHSVPVVITSQELIDYYIQQNGSGYYYFKVRAISGNIEEICNGDWSELSPAYHLTGDSVETQLDGIVADSGSMTDDEIRDSVQSMDTADLKEAMLADQDNTGAVADIAALEEEVGGPAPVEVSEEASDFDADKVTIVGANLNNSDSDEPITLVIDKPQEDHVIDDAYDNSVAVSFSMDLENVEDPENLEVPVKITMPVPETINPEFLVILHYHVDGTVEEIRPYIYAEDGEYYASFVLTSFSDFVMTQPAGTVPSEPDDPADVTRVFGDDRYATAFAIADTMKEVMGIEQFNAVVISNSENFPDALAGSYLAAMADAPILLTKDKASRLNPVKEYISENLVSGGKVYILGSEAVVPASLETDLTNAGYDVERLAGTDRYETNLAVLRVAMALDPDKTKPILVSTGRAFADSLSVSASGLPLLLVRGDKTLTDTQKAFLEENADRARYVIGSEGVVYANMYEAVGATKRIAGSDRYETSVAVANELVPDANAVVLAYASDFPDGLCGGPLAYQMGASLILTKVRHEDVAAAYVAENDIPGGYVLGSDSLVTDEVVNAIFAEKDTSNPSPGENETPDW